MLLPRISTANTGISEALQPQYLLQVCFIFVVNCFETAEFSTVRSEPDDRSELGRSVASLSTLAGAIHSLLV